MTVDLVPVTEEALFFICSNMREHDHREIYCTRWDDNPNTLTSDCMWVIGRPSSVAVIARHDKMPVAVMGAVETWPGAWDVWCFGTDDFDHVALSLTKYVKRVMIPAMLRAGMRRAHCRSMVEHEKSHEWLRAMGAKPDDERPMKNWGKNNEDFIMFEWHRDDLLKQYGEAA